MKNTSEELRKMMKISDDILEIVDNADKITRSDLQGVVEVFVRKEFDKNIRGSNVTQAKESLHREQRRLFGLSNNFRLKAINKAVRTLESITS